MTGRVAPPRVAVVVPAFNAAAFLGETLDSVAAQTFQAWECIVVDDGSTDATADVAARYVAADRRFRLVQQSNTGLPGARNAALAVASEGVTEVAFLDSDDTWLPHTLTVLLAGLTGRPDAVGAYGVAEYMDAGGTPVRPGAHSAIQRDRRQMGRIDLVDVPESAPSTFSTLVVSGTIWPPAVGLFRRATVDDVGRFDPTQRYVEDWDLWLRMSRLGSFHPLPDQVAWYRQHADNMTKRAETMAFFHARVRWKAWASNHNTRAQRRESQRVWRRLQLRYVLWSAQAGLRAARRGERDEARDAWSATALFTRQLLAGHPPEPTDRMAQLITRFVVPRSMGRGFDL